MSDESAPEASLEGLAQGADGESESPADEIEALEAELAPQEPAKRTGVGKRIDELTANWRGSERRAEEAERRNAELIEILRSQHTATRREAEPAPTLAQAESAPDIDQFATYEEFTRASARYEARQILREERAQAEAQRQAAEREQNEQTFSERLRSATSKYPDFDSVVRNPDVPINSTILEIVRELDDGTDVLYALGQNPSEARRIAALSPRAAAVEIGRFAKAHAPAAPAKPSIRPTPAPLNALGGNASVGPVDPTKFKSGDEYQAWRLADLKAKRK
jgi:hypothetical protein